MPHLHCKTPLKSLRNEKKFNTCDYSSKLEKFSKKKRAELQWKLVFYKYFCSSLTVRQWNSKQLFMEILEWTLFPSFAFPVKDLFFCLLVACDQLPLSFPSHHAPVCTYCIVGEISFVVEKAQLFIFILIFILRKVQTYSWSGQNHSSLRSRNISAWN